jgi:three-Cys-motif partner protein
VDKPNISCVDKIGEWSEIKLDLIQEYMKVYATIMGAEKQAKRFRRIYVDAFASAGVNWSRKADLELPGSPIRALSLEPKFHEYIFIEKKRRKCALLRSRCATYVGQDITVWEGDSNEYLLQKVFPRFTNNPTLRALLLIDPYGLDYDWRVVQTAGGTKAVDLILNFPISDAFRNALRRSPDKLDEPLRKRWVRACGCETWQSELYRESRNRSLFDGHPEFSDARERRPEREVARWYRERIRSDAGFAFVSEPLVLQNSQNSTLFHIFLASQKEVATKVMNHIVKKHSKRESQP